jgi:NAD+ kinase
MAMNPFSRVILVYKKSTYKIFFLERKSSLYRKQNKFSRIEMDGFWAAHQEHYRTLAQVETVLRQQGIRYRKICRGRRMKFEPDDLVVTVGGDGTFLEAARSVTKQMILGVNSDPKRSTGRFCAVQLKTFEGILDKILAGKARIAVLPRMALRLEHRGRTREINVLNDILISNTNPAAMSRYYLTVSGYKELQCGSGLWISTAAGSSGGIYSAGGKIIPRIRRIIQYKPRESYQGVVCDYRLFGGVVKSRHPVVVESLMRTGMIFVDGAHFQVPFGFGEKAVMTFSSQSIRVAAG